MIDTSKPFTNNRRKSISTTTADYSTLTIADSFSTETQLGLNITNNATSLTPAETLCPRWPHVDDLLFQAALVCLSLAVLLSNWRTGGWITSRLLVCSCWLLMAAWASWQLCSVGVLSWSAVIVTANLLVIFIRLWRRQLAKSRGRKLAGFHRRQLQPFFLDHFQLQQLVCHSITRQAPAGSLWAEEQRTPVSQSLSILLSGRMEVTSNSVHMHFINPSEFINSFEWDLAYNQHNSQHASKLLRNMSTKDDYALAQFQVTIRCLDDCEYLILQPTEVNHLCLSSPFLFNILQIAIGKDIMQKVYRVIERDDQKHREYEQIFNKDTNNIKKDRNPWKQNFEDVDNFNDMLIRGDKDFHTPNKLIRSGVEVGFLNDHTLASPVKENQQESPPENIFDRVESKSVADRTVTNTAVSNKLSKRSDEHVEQKMLATPSGCDLVVKCLSPKNGSWI